MTPSRPSSPSFSAPKSSPSVWTARLVATLWKLAVKHARKLRRHSQGTAGEVDTMYGSALDTSNPTSVEDSIELDATIMHEAALSVVASGVVSLADLEAITGFRLSKNHGTNASSKDDDTSSEAATDTSDVCSIADSDESEHALEDEPTIPSLKAKEMKLCQSVKTSSLRRTASSSKAGKWVCVGYGRYMKVQD